MVEVLLADFISFPAKVGVVPCREFVLTLRSLGHQSTENAVNSIIRELSKALKSFTGRSILALEHQRRFATIRRLLDFPPRYASCLWCPQLCLDEVGSLAARLRLQAST